jgi:Na+-translocating ferredoxin:NAD+ oxidoreductase RnfC subunit
MIDTITDGSISSQLRETGLSGAGGAGFPTYPKWDQLESVDSLLVNHQESDKNCYMDKWIGREHAAELAELFEGLLAGPLERVVIGAKLADREWSRPLEKETDATVYLPDELPIDPSAESGVVFAYTEEKYQLGMENVLLQEVGEVVLGKDLPIDYGWVVQNTETLYNMHRALANEEPVLDKYVHVDGYLSDGSRVPHRMFKVPIGTSAEELLAAAGVDPNTLGAECIDRDRTLVDGGPGWCFTIQRPADRYGVTKHTNCLMLLDDELIEEHTYGNGRIDVRDPLTWDQNDHATEPVQIEPDRVHIPTVTNETYDDVVAASTPLVGFGDDVKRGEEIAKPKPNGDGFSVSHHATIDGKVADVTPREVEIRSHEI